MTNELIEAVMQLTQPHKKTVHTVDGLEIHEQPGLLDQLKDAVFGGMEKTGGSGSMVKLPVSEAAVDLHELIDQQIAEAWAAALGGVPRLATPAQMLMEWAAVVREDHVVVVTHPEQHERADEHGRVRPFVIRARTEYTPLVLARRWVAMIQDFLDPERTAGIKAPCLQCGATKVARRRDGGTVISDALVFRRDRDTGRTLDARCLNCGIVWPPSQFDYLAQALGIILDVTVPDTPTSAPMQLVSEECADGAHEACTSVRCRCAHHHPAPVVSVAPARAHAYVRAGTMTGTVGSVTPLVRPVCPECWTEQSVTGGCMCP